MHISLNARMPSVRMKVSALLLAFLSCCAVVSASSSVVINEGDSLKSLLCGNENGTQLADTTILLNQSHLYLNYEEGSDSTVCLIENTHDVAIIPSQQVLDLGFKSVTVHCKSPVEIGAFGFAFLNVHNLTIRSAVFRGCGAIIPSSVLEWVNQTDQVFYFENQLPFTLLFSHCYNLKLHNISVGNTTLNNSLDLIGINLCGTSEINYTLLKMFVYFADTTRVNSTVCKLSVSSTVISSKQEDKALNYFADFRGREGLPVRAISDIALFFTQSFPVNTFLVIDPHDGYCDPIDIAIAFVNSMSSSRITLQGFGSSYEVCQKEDRPSFAKYSEKHISLALEVIFYETPSFRHHSSKTNDNLTILPTAFRDRGFNYSLTYQDHMTMLQIKKFTGKLSREVRLKNVSTLGDNSTTTYHFQHTSHFNGSVGHHRVVLSYTDIKIHSQPTIKLKNDTFSVGFGFNNRSCECNSKLSGNGYTCKCELGNQRFVMNCSDFWLGLVSGNEPCNATTTNECSILFHNDCPPTYCTEDKRCPCTAPPSDPLDRYCSGHRTGILCGRCKEGFSNRFGTSDCYRHCTNLYLLTLPVYAIAGLLLVLLLFALRLTVAKGTINGFIFYAAMLGLVMDEMTRGFSDGKKRHMDFVRVVISLLNLNLGFPLCFYEGMTTAARVGLQFVFPVYIWGIAVGLIVLSKYSTRVSNYISGSSVQVLATLIYISLPKVLWAVVLTFNYYKVYEIKSYGSYDFRYVWYLDGTLEFGHGSHIVLLVISTFFVLFFLLPYAILTTFSPCLERFHLVNRFRPFVDAYGGPFRTKWRFWFGLRLWLTGALFCVNHIVYFAHPLSILIFTLLQCILWPFKNTFIGLLDTFFMVNYLLIVLFKLNTSRDEFFWSYALLTTSALVVMCCIVLFHILPRKLWGRLEGMFQRKRGGYVAISEGHHDSDADLFTAAEQRTLRPVLHKDTY